MTYDLDFERPLAELEKRIQSLRSKRPEKINTSEIASLEQELSERTAEIYSGLTPWQRVLVARHKNRPYTADYIRFLFNDFFEMRGDRAFGDDHAILTGIASFNGQTVVIIGNQKGRDIKEKQECNFGLAHPEGYRKAQRVMQHAEKFGFPVITFVDTAGAFPGLESEERGISEAIADNLLLMAVLRTPIVSIVIGEGGSGGALGIGVADRTLMMENSVYTVAAPEAAASILWKDSSFAHQAAEAMKITADDLYHLKLIDGIVPEPIGGAHKDPRTAANYVGEALKEEMRYVQAISLDMLLEQRYQKLRSIGAPDSLAALKR